MPTLETSAFWSAVASSVTSAAIVALLAALISLAFWNRVKQRFLVGANRVPFVELDQSAQNVRNIGSETFVNGALYHLRIETGRKTTEVAFVCALPNLMSGEAKKVEALTDCGVIGEELFLIQYHNVIGMPFGALVEPAYPRGDNQILHSPRLLCRRSRWATLGSRPDLRDELPVPCWMRKELERSDAVRSGVMRKEAG
ncbi:MAG: hypothetical protein LBV00_02000 [Propionibacteriaceae bacterium]|jgi:hypothetical protein|nr:hypothetical protein [Propionibacteriaceae bacterium]